MVQQQVAAAFNGAPQPQVGSIANGAISVDATTLAMPAIINSSSSNSNSNSTTIANHSPQSQYSPQASLYQQQLIKSAQQFVAQHQQQPRLNGLNGTSNLIQQQYSSASANGQQQHQQTSPATNHLFSGGSHSHQTESLYNNGQQQAASRPAPAVYAPKPNYYGQITQQQQQQNNSQIYQQQAAVGGRQVSQLQTSYYAAQNSPIGASQTMSQVQQQHQPMALSVRQAPVFQGQTVSSLSPSQHQQQQQMIEQQQRQMQQQLVMSYQDQQQQIQQLQATYSLQQQHQPLMAATLSRHQVLDVPQQTGAWPVSQQDLEQQQQHQQLKSAHAAMQQQQQPMFHPAVARQLTGGVMASGRPTMARAGAFSDRDSVSTLSRFNQFDDRRSFTMRSQFTAQPIGGNGKRNSQFGFLELTSEAMRRLLGFSGGQPPTTSQRQPLLLGHSADQLQQNLSIAAATNEHHNKQQVAGLPSAQQQVTVIDSGEDQQFKRQVFRYQLGIVRLVHLLLSAFVLLSPLAMLLIPKMEPLLRSLESTGGSSGSSSSSLEYNSQEPPVAPPTSPNVVTHAVGLLDRKHLATKHQQHQMAAAPWHIGECQSSECDGPLIGFVIRLIMLAIAHWAIFFRRQTVTLPRVDFQRCFLISLALLVTCAYWLFFMFRVFDKRHNLELELPYMTIVQFAISMLETLILLHYLALVLVELRRRKKVFCLKVVRSPDGESKYYSAGTLSIQKCAQFVLEKYHRDFSQFDSYREQLLEFEDRLAHHLKRQRQSQQAAAGADSSGDQAGEARQRRSSRRQRSRANSPQSDEEEEEPTVDSNQEDEEGEEETGEETRGNRRARHHRRPHHHSRRHRSNSRHARDREREEEDEDEEQRRSTRQKRNEREIDVGEASERLQESGGKKSRSEQKQAKSDVNGDGDQHESSDNTSRMKESSLETIRAAGGNSGSDQQATTAAAAVTPSKVDIEISEHPKQQVGGGRSSRRPDELESVRSARSRRSTGNRTHHRSSRSARGDHHHSSSLSSKRIDRERSSSRARGQHHTTIELENAVQDSPGHESSTPIDQMDEHERKLRRRKLRLLAAVEDSFEQIKLLDEAGPSKHHQNTADMTGGVPVASTRPTTGLDASQTARSLYPNIARALQKYLRLTKQTGRHNLASIYEHLSKCLLYKLSARAFLEKFTNLNPVWQQSETNLFANCRLPADPASQRQQAAFMKHRHQELEINSWSLICDNFLSRQIDSGTFFVLKQGQVSLLVTVARLPHLSLSEHVIDQSQCRFTTKPASGKSEISSV